MAEAGRRLALLLGAPGRLLEAAAAVLLAAYVFPLVYGLLLFPPSLGLPFSLGWAVVWTVLQAAAAASASMAVGWPLGVLAGFYGSRWAGVGVLLSLAPFMSPVVVAALGLRAAYMGTPLGFLAEGWSGVVALHAYFNIGLAASLTAAAAGEAEASVVEHAVLSGLRGPRLWLRVLLPLTARAAVHAWVVAFLYSATSAAPLLVAGAAYRYYTLEAWLYTLFHGFPGRLGSVVLLALVEVAAALLLGLAYQRLAAAARPAPLAARGMGLLRLRGFWRLAAAVYAAGVVVFLYAPLAALAANAAGASLDRLEAYASQGPGLAGAVANSLFYAAATAAAALPLGVAAAVRGGLGAASLATIAVTPVAYGVMATLVYYRSLEPLVGAAAASRLLILLAHQAAALPLASRALEAGLARVPGEVWEHATLLGLRGSRLLASLYGMLGPHAAAAAGLAAAASLGEFGATIVVSVPETWSLTVLTYRLMGSGRLFREACLSALILEALSLTVLAAAALPLLRHPARQRG